MVYYVVSVLFLLFFLCPCMAIDVRVQHNGGLLPDIILLTQCYFVFAALIPPKHFDISPPPDWGMLRRSRRVLIFL